MLEIIEVNSPKLIQQFHQFTRDLYKDDSHFVSHIDQDIEAIFDPKKNASFTDGEAKRWLIKQKGKVVGKIAAFYNTKQSGIGFFDCINSQLVANALFSEACNWLKQKGQTAVEAPVNFGERDKYWGLLVEGFKNPSYQEPYNFPYYQELFENYGFKKEFEQTTSEVNPSTINEKIFQRYRNRAQLDSNLQARHFKFNQMDKYVHAFVEIYNKAWEQHEFFIPLTVARVTKLFKEMKPILREDIMWFVFDGEKGNYSEKDDVNPISVYGKSKADAEKYIVNGDNKNWSIVRTIIVYGKGNNLSRSNLIVWAKESLEKETKIKIIDDQYRAPTFASDLATACIAIIQKNKTGIFNISGPTTYSIFEIVSRIGNHFGYSLTNVERISSSTLNQPAKRPPKTGFDLTKAKKPGTMPGLLRLRKRLLSESAASASGLRAVRAGTGCDCSRQSLRGLADCEPSFG